MDDNRVHQEPSAPPRRHLAILAMLLLALSAGLVFSAPLFMPAGYDWTVHSISESAAQGLHNAWIARLGFLCYGAAAMLIVSGIRPRLSRGCHALLMTFGISLLATAAFSHSPWLPGAPDDRIEDLLHSLTANIMGTAFTVGVLLHLFQRGQRSLPSRLADVVAAALATLLPLWMLLSPGTEGLVQRPLFLTGYLWFAYRGSALFGTRHRHTVH